MVSPLFLLCLATYLIVGQSQQNVASEGICQYLLTNKKTTPLDPANKRNLTFDEDAEFECELVLQDLQLPKQIRSTIHEGLSWLAVRHVQAGLRRHVDVVRHMDHLLHISPHHHSFAYRAGYWSVGPLLANFDTAISYLGKLCSHYNDVLLIIHLVLLYDAIIRVRSEWESIKGTHSIPS